MTDLRDELSDYANQEIDQNLEKIQYELDLELRLAELDMERLEWQFDMFGDSVADAAKKFEIMSKQMGISVKQAESAEQSIEKTLSLSGIKLEELMNMSQEEMVAYLQDKNLTEEQISQLEEDLSTMYDATESMKELKEAISDTLVESFESMNEEFDKSIDNVSHLTSMVESYQNIIDLAGKDAIGVSDELLERMGEAQYNLAHSNTAIAKAQLEQNKAALADIQAKLDAAQAAGNTELAEEFKEAYDEVYETVKENEEALLESVSTELEARVAMFDTQMNNIIESFEDAMAGAYGSFSALQEAFDQQNELADRYVDDYEKIYELSKLTRDINNSIDDTDNLRGKERLLEIQQEINKLQESGVQMSKYEVEELRARYDLRLAEIALEEAQNSKTSVRMSRDATGNWGYVYTADSSAVDTTMQKYEDTLFQYQQKMQTYTDELQARLVSIPQEYAEAVRAIYEDQTLTDEERRIRIAETQAYYQEMYAYVVGQMGVVNEDARILYEQDWTRYAETTGYKISENDLWVDNFSETIAANVLGFDNLESCQDAFLSSSESMLDDLSTAYSDYRDDVSGTLEDAIGDIEDFVGDDETEGSLTYFLKVAEDAAKDQAEAAQDMATKNKTAFSETVQAAEDNYLLYEGAIKKWVDKTGEISTAVGNLTTAYAGLSLQLQNLATDYSNAADAQAALTGAQLENREASKTKNKNAFSLYYAGSGAGKSAYHMTDVAAGTDLSTATLTTDENGHHYLQYTSETGGTVGGYVTKETAASLESQGVRTVKKTQSTVNTSPKSSEPKDTDPPFEVGDKVKFKATGNLGNQPITNLGKGASGKYDESWTNLDDSDINGKTFKVQGALGGYGMNNGQRYYTLEGLTYKGTWGDRYNYIVPEKSLMTAFDTGGYTGEWDSSGRLAMLHQKEIVLNAHDTENFLSAIDILHNITKVIDLQAMAQSNALGSLASATTGAHAQVIEQDVTIHAEFPNATNHSEIEEAFNTLLNRASQFANRKN